MRTFIENYLHFMKNSIRPHYEKLKSLKSGFIENSIFENNRDPCGKPSPLPWLPLHSRSRYPIGVWGKELLNSCSPILTLATNKHYQRHKVLKAMRHRVFKLNRVPESESKSLGQASTCFCLARILLGARDIYKTSKMFRLLFRLRAKIEIFKLLSLCMAKCFFLF